MRACTWVLAHCSAGCCRGWAGARCRSHLQRRLHACPTPALRCPALTLPPLHPQAVCLLLRQFDGLKAGYRARRAELQAAAAAAGGGGGGGASAVDGLVGEMSDWDFLFQTSNGGWVGCRLLAGCGA